MNETPALAVLAVVGAGLALAGTSHWRFGVGVVGLGLLLAAGLRLTLAPKHAGWLVVRSRAFDAALLLLLAFAVIALAVTIPHP